MNEQLLNTIGYRLHQLITMHDLSKKKFAELTGMNYSQLHRIIRGDGTPGFENLMRIKTAFPETSLDWLISGVGFFEAPDDREWEMLNALRGIEAEEEILFRAQLRMRWFEEIEIGVINERIAERDDLNNQIKEKLYGRLYLKHIERRRISISRDQTKGNSRSNLIESVLTFLRGKEGAEDKQLNKITSSIYNFCLLKSKEAKEILNQN